MAVGTALKQKWLHWLRSYVLVAERFVGEEPIGANTSAEAELLSLKTAVFARALALFTGTTRLLEHDLELDVRIHARGVIEAAMYLVALDRDPEFLRNMKDDDYKSRQSRASIRLAEIGDHLSEEIRRLHEDFLAKGAAGAKSVQICSLLDGSEFTRLYSSYRDICGDAAHVSISALRRHYVEHENTGVGRLVVHPMLEGGELHHTMTEMGISMVIATSMLMRTKKQSETWNELAELLAAYGRLVIEGQRLLTAADG